MESCPINFLERAARSNDPDVDDILMAKHNSTVRELAILMDEDPEKFTALEACLYIDSIWARYFDQIFPMGNFTVDFLDRMMLLQQDWFNQTIAMNETTRKLFVTGSTSAVVKNFKKRIEQDKDPAVNEKDVLKYFFYSDHDDSIETLSTAFGYALPGYPPFASHIVYELWRQGNKTNGTQSYHVLMRINDANVTLQGPCGQ